jgi:hypothetical protein
MRAEGAQRVFSKMLLGAAFGLFVATLVVISVGGWIRAWFGKKPSGEKKKAR